MYAAFHRGDAEGALAHFHPDVAYDVTRRLDGGEGRGREALAATIARWVGTFDDWEDEIEELREFGDRVYVVLRQQGRGKLSGVELDARYAVLYETDGEMLTRLTIYPDPAEALRAAQAGPV